MRFTFSAAVAASFAVVSVPASAEVLTLDPVAIPTLSAPQGIVSFAKFDASLGVLDSVTLSFDTSMSTKIDFINKTSNSRTFAVNGGVTASLTGNGFNLSDAYAPGETSFTLARQSTGSQTYTDTLAAQGTLSSALAAFIGSGNVEFTFARASTFSTNPNNSVITGPTIGGTARLSYTYTPVSLPAVPEPATWAMMVGGFGLIGAASRRRAQIKVTLA